MVERAQPPVELVPTGENAAHFSSGSQSDFELPDAMRP